MSKEKDKVEEKRLLRNAKQREYRKTDKYKELYEKNKEKIAAYTREYNQINKEKIKERRKKYLKQNKEKIEKQQKEYVREYNKKNKSKVKERNKNNYKKNKDKVAENNKKYYAENKQRCLKINKEWKKNNRDRTNTNYNDRYRKDVMLNLNHRMSSGVRNSLTSNNLSKNRKHWEDIVGYTKEELQKHLESLFIGNMRWDKILNGEIHVDHIIPISFFKFKSMDDVEFKYCWSLNNLQPLWAKDNLRKNNKINYVSIC